MALALKTGDVATPLASVVTVAAPAKEPLAPEPGAANVTLAPLTGLPPESFTIAFSGSPNGVLIGALSGVMEAQYNVLRKNGHSPSEAFNETVEELTQSLIRLVGENGMDFMYANCSTTAQRGALDWHARFRYAVAPVFDELYESVRSGNEARITLEANSRPDYREQLDKELAAIRESEMWRAGAAVRSLRPENWKKE